MESRASLNSSTSDVLATNWKAPREPATLSIMNLYLGGQRHRDVKLCRRAAEHLSATGMGGTRREGREDNVRDGRRTKLYRWAARKAPDVATTTSTLESDVIQLQSRFTRELARTGKKCLGDCWSCCTITMWVVRTPRPYTMHTLCPIHCSWTPDKHAPSTLHWDRY